MTLLRRAASLAQLVVALVLCAAPIHADTWVAAETPAAIAVSAAQQGVFRPGAMPALGIYRDFTGISIGGRLRAGVLRDGPSPEGNRADPGIGGLATAGAALRIGSRGIWFEGAVAVGVTGRDIAPVGELGAGLTFDVGHFAVGPSLRYVRVVSRDTDAMLGTAELVLVGVDVQFGRRRERPPVISEPPPQVAKAPPPPPPPPTPPPPAPRDDDRIIDQEDSCMSELTGCQLTPDLVLKNDRIVLDERVLFDVNRARVRSAGRAIVSDLVRVWSEHPEWTSIVVEGHADIRGSDAYNLDLSQRRADRVRDYMVSRGADPARITAVGFGRSRPRATGTSDHDHERNRRVEFAISRVHTLPPLAGAQP